MDILENKYRMATSYDGQKHQYHDHIETLEYGFLKFSPADFVPKGYVDDEPEHELEASSSTPALQNSDFHASWDMSPSQVGQTWSAARTQSPSNAKKLKKIFDTIAGHDMPKSLGILLHINAFIAFVEYRFTCLLDQERTYIITELDLLAGDNVFDNFYPSRLPHKNIITYASERLNSPSAVAALVLGKRMGISPEFCFGVFPPAQPSSNAIDTDEFIGKAAIPKQLIVAGQLFTLRMPLDVEVDFKGNPEQALCQYQDEAGHLFTFMATRVSSKQSNSTTLQIGVKPGEARLFSRVEMDRKNGASVLLCQDLEIASQLRRLASESEQVKTMNIVVSGYCGGNDAKKILDFKVLAGHPVIIIPKSSKEGLLAVTDWICCCERGGAAEVRVYTGMLIPKNGTVPSTEENLPLWLKALMIRTTHLNQVETPSVLIRNLCAEAISPTKYTGWLHECGLVAPRMDLVAQDQGGILFRSLSDIQDLEKVTPENTLDAIIHPRHTTLIWGATNCGKSWCALELIRALTTGTTAFALKASRKRNAAYLDGEIGAIAFKKNCQQLCADEAQYEVMRVHLRVCSSKGNSESTENIDLSNLTMQEQISALLKKQCCEVVVIDNILALAPQAAKGNAKPFTDFVRRLGQEGIAVIVIHHASKGGISYKGPVELESLSQNVFHLEGREKLAENGEPSTALSSALEDNGPTMRMTVTKCKALPALERKSTVYHLPVGGRWELIEGGLTNDTTSEFPLSSVVPKTDLMPNTGKIETPWLRSNLTPDQEKVLTFARDKRGWFFRKDLEQHLDCQSTKATELLKGLLEHDLILRSGEGKTTQYKFSAR